MFLSVSSAVPFSPVDTVLAVTNVWRIKQKIIRTPVCCIVYHSWVELSWVRIFVCGAELAVQSQRRWTMVHACWKSAVPTCEIETVGWRFSVCVFCMFVSLIGSVLSEGCNNDHYACKLSAVIHIVSEGRFHNGVSHRYCVITKYVLLFGGDSFCRQLKTLPYKYFYIHLTFLSVLFSFYYCKVLQSWSWAVP